MSAQTPAPTTALELKGLPPRAAAADYQTAAQAGPITIAAEFTGHSLPTNDGTYESEEYVGVEAAFFGPPDARATVSIGDFSLRINGKKTPEPAAPYELVRRSLKDPNWSPPKPPEKPKTSFGGGGDDTSKVPVKMPMDLRLAMEQRVHAAAMLQGDRPLPHAGLLFFEYRGKTEKIQSLELIYNGPSGKATLNLQQ